MNKKFHFLITLASELKKLLHTEAEKYANFGLDVYHLGLDYATYPISNKGRIGSSSYTSLLYCLLDAIIGTGENIEVQYSPLKSLQLMLILGNK